MLPWIDRKPNQSAYEARSRLSLAFDSQRHTGPLLLTMSGQQELYGTVSYRSAENPLGPI